MTRTRLCWAAAVLVWLTLTIGLRPLALPDEGRYVGVAWDMLSRGDWTVPTLNGLPFFHKPPLFYWITAASLKTFGVHPWAARLAPLLGAVLMLGSLYALLARRADEATARTATLALATMPMLVGGSQYANLDMLVAGCITASICAGAEAVLADAEGDTARPAVLLAWTMAALGVLAKGLIGIVLPAAVLGVWLLLGRRWRGLWRLLWWPGPVLLLAIDLPWMLAVQQRHPGFLHYFIVYQHFQRYTEAGFNNEWPLWFYPAVLAVLGLPWTLGAVWWRRARLPASGLGLLMGCWLFVIVGFFSVPRAKLVGYVLPALPPMAVLLALAWRDRFGDRATWRLAMVSALLSVGLIGGVAWRDERSAVPLLGALRERAADEPLLSVGQYPYDLPLLLGLQQPLPVLLDWQHDPQLQRDSWARELAEAGAFDPARAAQVLLPLEQLQPRLCAASRSWVLTGAIPPAQLTGAQERVHRRHLRLWLVDLSDPVRRQALCGTPTSG